MNRSALKNSIEKVCKMIAPAWPLENSVAVNPYSGLSSMTFDDAAKLLDARGGIQMYMPLEFYFERMHKNEIVKSDIKKALSNKQLNFSIEDFLEIAQKLTSKKKKEFSGVIIGDLASKTGHLDYSEVMTEQVSNWLASYFDKFKGHYQNSEDFYQIWRSEMEIDLFPEVLGVKNFRKNISKLPKNSDDLIEHVIVNIGISNDIVEEYLHAVLLKLVGWASYCSGEDWQNNLYGGYRDHLKSLLAILLAWEYCISKSIDKEISFELQKALQKDNYNDYLTAQSILQESFEIAAQRRVIDKINTREKDLKNDQKPKAQMAFCIDVRSEVFRRNLEQIDDQIETIGFAGFFGIPLKYQSISAKDTKNQCPVLIPSGPLVKETTVNRDDLKKVKHKKSIIGKIRSAWISFKSGTVSSFSFVSPIGLFFLPKLMSDTFGWSRPVQDPKKAEFGNVMKGKSKLDLSEIPIEEQIGMAKSALQGMGLIKDFAPLVLFAGHGASSVNNPHATGLDCGACGGNSGEVNAVTATMILNNQDVRKALFKQSEINIPKDTLFIPCLHDTTTDEITIINEKEIPTTHLDQLEEIKSLLKSASKKTRVSRSKRFIGIKTNKIDAAIFKNANDWAQVRPEWGLAGCNSFIVAPRERTKSVDLEGKTFLHNYNWKTDPEFNVLENIMTAPMIVTSWINLQYYASTTDNEKMGAGNKTIHNVVGGMGVIEGAKGDLRIGLPMQSIHDGKEYQHLPQKLNVVIEAPMEAINEILNRHESVKQLLDNKWINLMVLNEQGKVSHYYNHDLQWVSYNIESRVTQKEKELVENL